MVKVYETGEVYFDGKTPVPSYDEWKELDDELKELATKNDKLAMENGRLKERLAIATKALESIASRMTWNEISQSKAEQALKEMEGVK